MLKTNQNLTPIPDPNRTPNTGHLTAYHYYYLGDYKTTVYHDPELDDLYQIINPIREILTNVNGVKFQKEVKLESLKCLGKLKILKLDRRKSYVLSEC